MTFPNMELHTGLTLIACNDLTAMELQKNEQPSVE